VWSTRLSNESTHELAVDRAVLTPGPSGRHHAGGPGGIAPSGGIDGSHGPIDTRSIARSAVVAMSCDAARRVGSDRGLGLDAHEAAMSAASAIAMVCTGRSV
jgi:hypothetical protein